MSDRPNGNAVASFFDSAATLDAVVIGFALSRIPAWLDRRRKATGYLRGRNAELEYAAKHARIYVEGQNGERILAPAYRMPTRSSVEGAPSPAWDCENTYPGGRESGKGR